MRHPMSLLVVVLLAVGCGGGEDGSGGIQSTPNAITLQQVQSAVFTPGCALSDCHRGASAPFGLDLSAGQTLGNVLGVESVEQSDYDRVERFNPTDSYVYMKVTGDLRISGDPMPPQNLAPALTDQQKELLRQWIEQGATP